MAAGDEVRLRYTAELTDLRKKLASIPDITGAEARKAVAELDKSMREVEKAQDRAAKAAAGGAKGTQQLGQASAQSAEALGKLRSALSLVSPEAAALAGDAQHAVDGLTGMAKGASLGGPAIAALGAALLVGASAWAAWTEEEREAEEIAQLVHAAMEGMLPLIDATVQARAELGDITAGLAEDERALASALREVHQQFISGTADARKEASRLRQEQESVTTQTVDWVESMLSAGLAGELLAPIVDALTTNSEEYGAQLDAVNGVIAQGTAATREYADTTEQLVHAKRRAREATSAKKDADKEATQAAREAIEVEKLRSGLSRDLAQAVFGMGEAEIAYREQLDQVAEAEARAAITTQEATALRAQAERDLTAATQAENEARQEARDEEAQAIAEAREKEIEAAEAAHQEVMDQIEAERQARRAEMDYRIDLATSALDATSRLLDASAEKGAQQARRAFAFQKAQALAGVAINTAEAIMKGFALFGPPPSPPGIAAAAAATAVGLTEAAVIGAQEAPTMHIGGTRGGAFDTLATVLPGEGVLDRATNKAVGGPAGVRELLDQDAGVRVSFRVGRREVREMGRTDLRAGGVMSQALRKAGRQRGPEVGMSGRRPVA